MIEGSSTDKKIVRKVHQFAKGKKNILLLLDSLHTHKHVLKELNSYSDLITKNNYIIVYDTIIEDMPKNAFTDRPWNKKDNPKTAVREFLKKKNKFEIDKKIENKLLITSCPDGFLKKVS
jgi:cephalosporin hydroxylase